MKLLMEELQSIEISYTANLSFHYEALLLGKKKKGVLNTFSKHLFLLVSFL